MTDTTRLRQALEELGIRQGGILMVHASLSGTGLSPAAVSSTLCDLLGPDGTLVVPAFTPENSDTSPAYRTLTHGMTERERNEFHKAMQPFEEDATPCPTMGALAEHIRTTPGAVRSAHPQTSFAAIGARAAELLSDHDPRCHLGERSPLARLYTADAQVLLLRVGFEACTAFHLAEYRMTPPPPARTYRCVVGRKGNWISYEDAVLDDSDFSALGAQLPRALFSETEIAGRTVLLFGMRDTVDAAQVEISGYRQRTARIEDPNGGSGAEPSPA
ncbi:AAC(3) family N-acetyltransferase [Streptomyces europaeiscabiei]|uniref:AAC(3) family N-acetyltransferase n=1 Tax=Streptomyces europaeiscabiei TaxID=146819 RepID=A0ABU4NBA6_9ACTN|nr:AAC(3) family N-acetyltransferase [Streptomyces europaeiscabiei]MDX2523900.1 AAC(3) family N-acetyltransferase [Streptomyces europaeiscabiei]MDX2760668.1 AAC(3) family N-acetyltransferase [Streptomyces europaeiscabiei]MDX3545174.1 AAC(3) family N-acetyltransferase [Streptomyces europaeiscabiei]MDX3554165.1 AAC(3) family N-acetyltransferase [Streptomyces europaeiscabiei]MDX3666559.1 AAC(3) family N-acetyltransferase [Streptomyces europaeiscabiei]